ncbi:MAG: hypothetical protein IKM52_04840, partial [Clostridia bacterium]|nr:hypothetical protein [Clostridia bacterium]
RGCSSLMSVTFHEYVDANGKKSAAMIHSNVFDGCTALKTVYYCYSGTEENSLLTVEESGNEAFLGAKLVFTYQTEK